MGASFSGNLHVIGALIDAGADLDVKDNEGNSALARALLGGHESAATLLREAGAVDEADEFHLLCTDAQVVHHAKNNDLQSLSDCFEGDTPSNANAKDIESHSALALACAKGHIGVVSFLLDKGVDVDAMDKYRSQRTALMAACGNGHTKIADMLIKAGANINVQDKALFSPLMIACESGNIETVVFLIKSGADLSLKNRDVRLP